MNEEDQIYSAWRESEAYAIPMTEEGLKLTEHRWYGFKAGWEAHKTLQEKINDNSINRQ